MIRLSSCWPFVPIDFVCCGVEGSELQEQVGGEGERRWNENQFNILFNTSFALRKRLASVRCCLSKSELKECQNQNIEKPLLVIDFWAEDEWGERQYSRGQINECTF